MTDVIDLLSDAEGGDGGIHGGGGGQDGNNMENFEEQVERAMRESLASFQSEQRQNRNRSSSPGSRTRSRNHPAACGNKGNRIDDNQGSLNRSDTKLSLQRKKHQLSTKKKKAQPAVASSSLTRLDLLDDSDVSDSDSDDDDLWLKSKPSGLTKSPGVSSAAPTAGSTSKTQGIRPAALLSSHLKPPPQESQAGARTPSLAKASTPSLSTASTSRPIVNPYASASKMTTSNNNPASRQQESPTLSPGIVYPKLRERTKLYADLRPNLLLALWAYARRNLTRDSYQYPRLDQFVSRIVRLAVLADDFPIRSVSEYAFRGTTVDGRYGDRMIDKDKVKELEYQLASTGWLEKKRTLSVDACQRQGGSASGGKYVTICEACLVAMRDEVVQRWRRHQHQQQQGQMPTDLPSNSDELTKILKQKDLWVSLTDLIPLVDARLSMDCPAKLGRSEYDDNGAAYYQEQSTKSAEFKQIEKLIVPPTRNTDEPTSCLKKHKSKGSWLFELTALGFKKANVIAKRAFPAPVGHFRSSNLKTVAPHFHEMCLAVDSREGGGAFSRKTQHEMCNTLDQTGIPYFVGSLSIGDYCFFSGDRLCPVIVERKSVQDVAMSIHDGRWQEQKHRMYHGQYVFGYGKCRLAFIIEGKLERQQVSGGYVGSRTYNVDKDRYEKEVEKLKEEGFQVILSPSVDSSMRQLARWARRVGEEVQNGTLVVKYTYNEFVELVKKIPREVDFSRLAKDNAQRDKESKEAEEKSAAKRKSEESVINLLDDDDDDDDSKKAPAMNRSTTKQASGKQSSAKRKKVEYLSPLNNDGSGDVGTWDGMGIQPLVLDKKLKKINRFGIDVTPRARLTADPVRAASLTQNTPTSGSGARRLASPVTANATGAKLAATTSATTPTMAAASLSDQNDYVDAGAGDYSKWTLSQLQEECLRVGLTKTGSKATLIAKLNGPRPPRVWIERQARDMYAPRCDTGATANLVAIQILQDNHTGSDFKGGTKDEIYHLAESLEITKNPYSGGTTQTGPYLYDGWSSMGKLCEAGDPPLVIKAKGRFRLSESSDLSGLPMARGMHQWAHQLGICKCEQLGYRYKLG